MVAKNTGHKLYGIWKRKYKDYYERDYSGNVYRDAAMLKKIAEELGEVGVVELMDYYFERRSRHELDWFVFNYDSLFDARKREEQDKEYIDKLRARTRERMEELGHEF